MAHVSSTDTRPPTAVRLAAWSAEHPGRAIGSWLVLIVLCVGAGMLTGTNRGTFDDFWIGEAGRAEAAATAAGVAPQPFEQILVTSPSGPLDVDAARAARSGRRAGPERAARRRRCRGAGGGGRRHGGAGGRRLER